MKIAVLLTCFNRKEKTLHCLKLLFSQNLPTDVKLEVFLVDDGSSDGTSEAVKSDFPKVNVIQGTGSLYWSGGMRLAWEHGKEADADYYLLLNDDSDLFPDALSRSISTNISYTEKHGIHNICVGRFKDPDTGIISYSGNRLYQPDRLKYYIVENSDSIEECYLGCANMMLVPKVIFDKIGNIDKQFVHAFGDFDYTIRSINAGFKAIIPPGIMGLCKNDHGQEWAPEGYNLRKRIKYLYSPTGLAFKEYMYFIGKHFPKDKMTLWLKIWVKTLFPWVYKWLK